MKTTLSLAVLALVPAIVGLAPTDPDAAFKCGNRAVKPGYLVVLDGKVVDSMTPGVHTPVSLESLVRADQIETLDVTCSDARHAVFGIEPGRDLIMIWKTPGPESAVRDAAERIKAAQIAYLAKTGAWASRVEDLGWSDPSGAITVTMTVSADQQTFTATAVHRYLTQAFATGTRP